jgi:uncharacterized membrane protein
VGIPETEVTDRRPRPSPASHDQSAMLQQGSVPPVVGDGPSSDLAAVLESMPRDAQTVLYAALASKSHKGPLPDPETLAAYDAIHPGALREILNGARDVRRHRMSMDRKVANTARLSLILTFVVVLAALGIGAWLGLHGQSVLGGLFGSAGLLGVIVAMLKGGGVWKGQ